MGVWINSFVAVFIVSLISFVGVFTLSLRQKTLKKILMTLVSFSAGALFAGALIHILPEVIESYGAGMEIFLFVMVGILSFFVLEKFVFWRHCHNVTCKDHPHPLGIMNLVGDGFHNLIDGLVIGAAFLVDVKVGIAATLAIVVHEIPQEIGDFGVLLHAGYTKAKALFYNFISALFAFLGVFISLIVGAQVDWFLMFLLPFAAGGFLYIAGSDLIPELKKELGIRKSFYQFLALVFGILVMVGLKLLLE